MYPSGELSQLERRKVILRGSIAVNRGRCVHAAGRIAQPLEWVDRGASHWRKISPLIKFGAIPLGFLVKRLIFPRSRVVGSFTSLLKWVPAVLGAYRAFKGMQSKAQPPSPSNP